MAKKNIWVTLLLILVFSIHGCKKENTPSDNTNTFNWGSETTTTISGRVLDESGSAVAGATVKAGNATTTTDNLGVFYLANAPVFTNLGYVTVTKQGYFLGSRSFLPTQGGTIVNIRMLSKANVGSFNAANGGVITAQGVTIQFNANSITQNNAPYTGQVNVALKYINPEGQYFNDEMPGNLIAVQDGNSRGLTSFGMLAVELTDNTGNTVKIADGQTSTVTFPLSSNLLSSAPAEIDLWSFDEANGYWKPEGKAILQNGHYVANPKHFSTWNFDVPWLKVVLNGQVKNAANNPIQGALVTVSSASGSASFYTNSMGYFSSYVPANEVLYINIKIQCSNSGYQSFYHAQINPSTFSVITISDPSITNVTGNLVDCNSNQLSTGYVVANNQAYFLNNGQFSFSVCANSVSIIPYASPVWASGQLQTFTLNGGSLNVGNLQVCNGANTGIVTDIDGNVYQTVQIGSQKWMAENLKTTRYANGEPIPLVTDNSIWVYSYTSSAAPAWCYFDNDSSYDAVYGKIYNWFAATDPRNVCPAGWHLPSDAEWNSLIKYIDPLADTACILDTVTTNMGCEQSDICGSKMRSTNLWAPPLGTNESGFTGLPNGRRQYNGSFVGAHPGYRADWWSSDEKSSGTQGAALVRALGADNNGVYKVAKQSRYKSAGCAIRCIKD